MKMHRLVPMLLGAVVLAAACKKDQSSTADTTSATSASTTPDSGSMKFDVGDIDMGRHVGPDKKITDKTDDFAPGDTIYASVHTKGGSAPAALVARWTFGDDSTVVAEETQNVQSGVDADTEFHITRTGGWPKGKYTLHLIVDGNEVKSKDVTVK